MRFMYHLVPTIPATPQERERLAPIAHRTDKTQEMLEEMIDLAQLAEEVMKEQMEMFGKIMPELR